MVNLILIVHETRVFLVLVKTLELYGYASIRPQFNNLIILELGAFKCLSDSTLRGMRNLATKRCNAFL